MNNKYGFTLIELLLYIGVVAVVIGGVSGVFLLSHAAFIKQDVQRRVEQEGVRVMDIILQTIRDADDVTIPIAGASEGTLSLTMAAAPLDPSLITTTSDIITLQQGAGSADSLHGGDIVASGLVFENRQVGSAPDSIGVEFVLTTGNSNGRNESYYSQTFYGSASLRK